LSYKLQEDLVSNLYLENQKEKQQVCLELLIVEDDV